MNAISPGPGLDALVGRITLSEAETAHWPEPQRAAVAALVDAGDALHAEAFRRLIRSLQAAPGGNAALRGAIADEVIYAVLRRHAILKPSLHERVEAALETVRPMLASHGGNVELVSVAAAMVEVRLLGACDGCPASALTLYGGVKAAIAQHVPEITDVRQVRGLGAASPGADSATLHFVSPFAGATDEGWLPAAAMADLPDGATRIVNLAGHALLLSRFGDAITCFENACAHMGLAMDADAIIDGIITCPFHGFRYALESGECLTAPEVQLQAHAARVVGDRIDVRLAR